VDTTDVRLASKTAADQKSQGRYVTLIQTVTNKLQFVPNPTTIKEFIEDNKHHLPNQTLDALVLDVDPSRKTNWIWSDDTVLAELLEDQTSNGWQWLDPEDIGALTSAPIIEAPDGRVYWHERYQIEAAAEAILLGTTVTFDGAPENKPLSGMGDDLLTPELAAAPPSAADDLDGKVSSKKTADDHGADATPSPAADVPTVAPVAPLATTGKYKYWTAEALSSVIGTLSGITDFDNDKAAQQAVAEMAEELNSRPKAAPEVKAAAKTASFDPELKRQIDYAIEGIYKFQINGEQDTQLITKALQSLKNVTTAMLSPEQQESLTRAIDELEAYDLGDGGDIARAVVELEDVVGRGPTSITANFGSFAVNEETSKVLEGDKSIPDGRDKVEDHTGITRPTTTTPSKIASGKACSNYEGHIKPMANCQNCRAELWEHADAIALAEKNLASQKPGSAEYDRAKDVVNSLKTIKKQAAWVACAKCNGSGQANGTPCGNCNASGHVSSGGSGNDNLAQATRDQFNKGASVPMVASSGTVAPVVNEETSKVLEGDQSIPDGRDKVEDKTGITLPSTESPSKFAADKTAAIDWGGPGKPDTGGFGEKIAPESALSETGVVGALRRLLYKLDGSGTKYRNYSKAQMLGLVEEALDEEPAGQESTQQEPKFASEKTATIEHRPGHKNSKGEAAPWVNVDKAGKVVSSSATEAEAHERLRAMEYYKNARVTEAGLASIRNLATIAVTAASKEAGEVSTSKALNLAETMSEKLKALYLDAKPLTAVNGTRPVREAVESVYASMVLFGEAAKALAKQDRQEKDEEAAAAAALPKKKAAAEAKAQAGRIGGLCIAADVPEDAVAE
jgi:hypothetical protein